MPDLNFHQQAAVNSPWPRIACMAAPGAGKTRVLVSRIVRLLRDGYHPSEIVAVTFTRKAGRELKERIEAAGIPARDVRQLTVATFHSWAASLLREFADVLDLHPQFTIRDERDRDDLIKFVGKEMRLPWKSSKRLWQENRVRVRYADLLREAHALDYDMLETELLRLLEIDDARRQLRNRYAHVLVDEFQDTSSIQQDILDRLDPEHLFVVGDHAQSIYGFRGASVEGFIELTERDGWRVLTLPTNYRSVPAIVQTATACGAAMATPGLEQEAARPVIGDDAVGFVHWPDKAESFEQIARELGELSEDEDLSDCAVLASTWRRLEEFAVVLDQRGIPYELAKKRMEVWSTDEARWAVSCMRVAANPHDHLSLWHALSAFSPRVSLGDWARARGRQATEGGHLEDHLPPGIGIVGAIKAARTADAHYDGPRPRAFQFLRGPLAADLSVLHLDSRVDGLAEFEIALTDWADARWGWGDGEAWSLQAFLDWYATRQTGDIETDDEDDEPRVQLMTIHGAKGLEWPRVWLLAAQEGDLPRRGADGEALEEQRRLFYVASTRAEDRLRWVAWKEPSRFVAEVMGDGEGVEAAS